MRTGPFTLWEMKKYIKKHSNVISEGIWPFQKGLSPMSDLKPQPISLKVKQFLPHVAAELELPTPLSPKVEKSLLEILSRVSPEPFGTGGTLRLSWFRTIVEAVYQNYIDECRRFGTTPDPTDHRILIAKNPVQLLHAIRSAMPKERFHGKVTLEGGYGKDGNDHDVSFIAASKSFESDMVDKYFRQGDVETSSHSAPLAHAVPDPDAMPIFDDEEDDDIKPPKTVAKKPTVNSSTRNGNAGTDANVGNAVNGNVGNGSGGMGGGGKITGVPPEMMKIILSLPKGAWTTMAGSVKSDGDLNDMMNQIQMLSGSSSYSPSTPATLKDLKKHIASI